jgi:hypothetical protein
MCRPAVRRAGDNQGARKMKSRFGIGVVVLASIGRASASAQSVETHGDQQVIVLDAAHIEEGNKYCFGRIEVSRDKLTYVVAQPSDKARHGFELPLGSIADARPGEQESQRYAELRLKDGRHTLFFHTALYENGAYSLNTESPAIFALPAAVHDFETTLKALEAGTRPTAEGPAPQPKVDTETKTISYLVAHAEPKNVYCYGWLHVSPTEVSYEVLEPSDKKDHGWRVERAQIARSTTVDRNDWRWIEILPAGGQVQAFGTAKEIAFGYHVILPGAYDVFDAVKAIQQFDSTYARLSADSGGTRNAPPEDEVTINDQPPCKAIVYIRSDPPGAEIFVAGQFMGSLPAKLELNGGLQKLVVRLKGHPSWEREINLSCNAQVNVVANLR